MELSMMLDYSPSYRWEVPPGDPRRAADAAAELETAGLDAVWVAEAWGFDSPTIMGYLAARRADIPVYVASLGPANVRMTAEVADGWLTPPYRASSPRCAGRRVTCASASRPSGRRGDHAQRHARRPRARPVDRNRQELALRLDPLSPWG